MVTRTAYILISILTVPAFLTSSTFSFGQSGRTYNYGHIRYAEGEVTLQRALELEAAEAAINVPVMPGDRMWTATYGLPIGSTRRPAASSPSPRVCFGSTSMRPASQRFQSMKASPSWHPKPVRFWFGPVSEVSSSRVFDRNPLSNSTPLFTTRLPPGVMAESTFIGTRVVSKVSQTR